MSRYLLDTTILVGFVRGANWAKVVHGNHNLGDSNVMVFTSIICCGEILALAEKNNWGKNKKDVLKNILSGITTIDINKESILNAYAMIKTWTQGHAVATQKSPPPKPAISMGQNDLWIAATAHASDATLLSADSDFVHLNGVWIKHVHVNQNNTINLHKTP